MTPSSCQLLFALSRRVDCSSSQHDLRQKRESVSQHSLHLVTERRGRNTTQQPWWRACQMTNQQRSERRGDAHLSEALIELVPICNAGRACCLEPTQMTSEISLSSVWVAWQPSTCQPSPDTAPVARLQTWWVYLAVHRTDLTAPLRFKL